MIDQLSQFVVRVAELFEAERTLAAHEAKRTAVQVALMFAAIAIALAGVGFLAAAFYQTIAAALSPAAAMAIVGSTLLVVAAILALAVRWNDRSGI